MLFVSAAIVVSGASGIRLIGGRKKRGREEEAFAAVGGLEEAEPEGAERRGWGGCRSECGPLAAEAEPLSPISSLALC